MRRELKVHDLTIDSVYDYTKESHEERIESRSFFITLGGFKAIMQESHEERIESSSSSTRNFSEQ